MNKLLTGFVLSLALAGAGVGALQAAEEGHDLAAEVKHAVEGGHFPVLKPEEVLRRYFRQV
jgi:ubiquinol-cytochrome c reductase cytochrome c1 subunit